MKPPRQTEAELQKMVVVYLRAQHPKLLFWHTPNTINANAAWHAKQKAMGKLAGVPDIAMVLPGGRAAFIELKIKGGRLSEDQKDFCRRCVMSDANWECCYSLDGVRETVSRWLEEA